MTLTDQEVIDLVDEVLARDRVPLADRIRHLRESRSSRPRLGPVIDRYLAIKDRPRTCQVEHDHWEGKMICGNPLPCRTHGGG